MMRIATMIFFLVVAFNNFAFAGTDGTQLLRNCGALVNILNSRDVPNDAESQYGIPWCIGFMMGILGTYAEYAVDLPPKKRIFCPPGEVSTNQMARIIVKYLKEHPEKLHEKHFVLALEALRQAYPCK